VGVLQRNGVSQQPSINEALYTYDVRIQVHVIVLTLDVRRVAVAGVDRPNTGGLETALPEPSLGQIIKHGCEDPIEVL
jgi:hypothetical protein